MATRTTRARAVPVNPASKQQKQKQASRQIKKEDTTSGMKATTTKAGPAKRKRQDDLDVELSSQRKPKKVKAETRDCDICAEAFSIMKFPALSTCDHDATVCKDCYRKQFETNIDDNKVEGWQACTCPLCNEAVVADEAHAVFPRDKRAPLDRKIKQARTEAATNFVWCPKPQCGHGQLHNPTKRLYVSCKKCKTKICFRHRVKWHADLTCQEYDEAGDKDETAKKDTAEIKRTTKPCPYCKIRVKKEGGCNHMVCGGCKKHWLWNDVAFDGETRGDSREVVGGPHAARVLGPDERPAVDQVMAFENAQVDGRAAADDRFGLGRIADRVQVALTEAFDVLGNFLRGPPIPVTAFVPLDGRLQNPVAAVPVPVGRRGQAASDGSPRRRRRAGLRRHAVINTAIGERVQARRLAEIIDLTNDSDNGQVIVEEVVTTRVVVDLTGIED